MSTPEDRLLAGLSSNLDHLTIARKLGEDLIEARTDLDRLGKAFAEIYSQALNGVVCDPSAEPGPRTLCASCLLAWGEGRAVLSKYDPHWGSIFRPVSFDVDARDTDSLSTQQGEPRA